MCFPRFDRRVPQADGESRIDPDDLRSNRIELTEAGKASADYAEQGLREVSGQSYCGFSEEEFSLLMDFYRRMRQNLTDYKEKLEGSD